MSSKYGLLEIIKDILLIAFLGTLIVVRCFEKNAEWIGLLSYISVLIALADLFVEALLKYNRRKGISKFVLVCVLIGVASVIFLGCIMTEILILDSVSVDILTLLTLIISLPHRLYLWLIGLILGNEQEGTEG